MSQRKAQEVLRRVKRLRVQQLKQNTHQERLDRALLRAQVIFRELHQERQIFSQSWHQWLQGVAAAGEQVHHAARSGELPPGAAEAMGRLVELLRNVPSPQPQDTMLDELRGLLLGGMEATGDSSKPAGLVQPGLRG